MMSLCHVSNAPPLWKKLVAWRDKNRDESEGPVMFLIYVPDEDRDHFWPGQGPAPEGSFVRLMDEVVVFESRPVDGGTLWLLSKRVGE